MGVVSGNNTIIGEYTKILHNVTIGSKTNKRANPIIGKNVLIGSGVSILGEIIIRDNSKIGATAFVMKDVEENTTYIACSWV